ncbi:LOW QUALITY PROTEIN: hypothetical protein OSB04_019028 [Centaurea solstitialis]|uniref:Retrotransposon gag domain-containing protein n=1 Tax=Centaurea solstitialis TaxID=347529 RepID=A0AA38WBZ8_9ASTR|nr:LOW QUALITY PROTEIN: hypothetical protein OSB04_019028 [Centaurea solstitialis]
MNQQWKTVLKRGETLPVLTRSRLAGARSSLAAREIRSRKKKKRTNTQGTPLWNLNNEKGHDQPMWTTRRAAPTATARPITKPNLEGDIEIKGQFLHMIRELNFDGKAESDPNLHIESFLTFVIFLGTKQSRMMQYRHDHGYGPLEPSSIATWNELRNKFISRFFPPSKLRPEIRTFKQREEETITEAWERFKRMLNLCPCHGLSKSEQVQTFYSGLDYISRSTLDSSAGGVFMYKTPVQGYQMLEDMLIHNIDGTVDKRANVRRFT